MAVVRRLTSHEMKDAIRLSDATFREAGQPSMGISFPFIFSDASLHLSYGAFEEDGRLVSFMGLVPWKIRIGEAELSVFSLGSVCTEPMARGKGYAGLILRQVRAFTRQAGASLLLVSGDRSLYTRSGCAHFGRVRRYVVDNRHVELLLDGASSARESIREMTPEDLFALHGAAASRTVRYQLGVNELTVLLKAEAFASVLKLNHRVLVHETDGTVTGFAVIGISGKTNPNGMVLEHAGESKAVARLFAEAVSRYDLQRLDVPIPWQEEDLHAQLAAIPSSLENHAGTLGIVSGEALIRQLSPWLEQRGDVGGLALEHKENGNWLFERGGDRPSVELTTPELIRLIFDCADADENPLPEGVEAFGDLFPVPFPITAALCYI